MDTISPVNIYLLQMCMYEVVSNVNLEHKTVRSWVTFVGQMTQNSPSHYIALHLALHTCRIGHFKRLSSWQLHV